MKNFYLLFAVMAGATLLLSACGDGKKLEEAGQKIDAIVKKLNRDDPDASEHTEARMIHLLDIDKDGRKDAVAFFTIEGMGGGNGYSFYMTVLYGGDKGFSNIGTLKVGGKGERHVNFDKIALDRETLVVETTEYAEGDPMCCPSRPGEARFSIARGHLAETGPVRKAVVETH